MDSVCFMLDPDHTEGCAKLMREHLLPALFHEHINWFVVG